MSGSAVHLQEFLRALTLQQMSPGCALAAESMRGMENEATERTSDRFPLLGCLFPDLQGRTS